MAMSPAILALIQAKLSQGGLPSTAPPVDPSAVPGAPVDAPVAAPFATTNPAAVSQMLDPLAQAQAADQAQLVQEQQTAASGAMEAFLNKLAAGPNPMAWAARGGPARPVTVPSTQDVPSGKAGY